MSLRHPTGEELRLAGLYNLRTGEDSGGAETPEALDVQVDSGRNVGRIIARTEAHFDYMQQYRLTGPVHNSEEQRQTTARGLALARQVLAEQSGKK